MIVKLKKRSFDEMIKYFNNKISDMDISPSYKMELLGMIKAIGFKYEEDTNKRTGKWISCKKQLPPTTMICHCTVQEDRLIGTSMKDRYTMDLIYDDILNEWNRLSGMKISSSVRVIAWMKAAEPYGGE